MKVLLIVNLTDNFRKALGCNRARAVRLDWANTQTLSQQELLIESSCLIVSRGLSNDVDIEPRLTELLLLQGQPRVALRDELL